MQHARPLVAEGEKSRGRIEECVADRGSCTGVNVSVCLVLFLHLLPNC